MTTHHARTIIGEEHWEEFVRGHEEGKTGYYVWDVIRFVRERG